MSAYNPPSENVPTFDSSLFRTANSGTFTKKEADGLYLHYPIGQGNETIPSAVIGGQLTAQTNIIMSGTPTTNYLQFPDGTKQYTASSGGGATTFTLTSNAVGTNSWTFTIPNSYGRAFSYSLYTDTTPTNSAKNGLTIPMNYGTPALNGGFIFSTGNAVYQPYSGTSGTQITYCSGFQQQYTISASGGAYIFSSINSMGGTFTITLTTNSVGENTAPCPPVASGGFTTIYTITSSVAVASCSLKLVGQVVAS